MKGVRTFSDNDMWTADVSGTAATLTYRDFRSEVLTLCQDRERIMSDTRPQHPIGVARKRILAFRRHLVWYGAQWIETSRYPAPYIYRALGIDSRFPLTPSRADRWLRLLMHVQASHTVMRYARRWLAMARTYHGREFIFRLRVPVRGGTQRIDYTRSLDYAVRALGIFASDMIMDRFMRIHFSWIQAARGLGLHASPAMLDWLPKLPSERLGKRIRTLVRHGAIIAPSEIDWATEGDVHRPWIGSDEQWDEHLVGQIIDILRKGGIARKQIVVTLCTVAHHRLDPVRLARTLTLLKEYGIEDRTALLAELGTCLWTIELERWQLVLDGLDIREAHMLIQFRRLLEGHAPYSVTFAQAMKARGADYALLAQCQSILLAAAKAPSSHNPLAALDLLMSETYGFSIEQIVGAEVYLCQPGDLTKFLVVLARYRLSAPQAMLAFQTCYDRMDRQTFERLLALATPLQRDEPIETVVKWITAARGGDIDAYEYLSIAVRAQSIGQLHKLSKLAFLGVPLLKYLVEERELSSITSLMKWFYDAFGIESVRWWRPIEAVERTLLDYAYSQQAFNLLNGNLSCIEEAVRTRAAAKLGSFPFNGTEKERNDYHAAMDIECARDRAALLPALPGMLRATKGILLRSVVDRAWDGTAAYQQQLTELTPLLNDLLAGRGPIEEKLTRFQLDAIALIYRTTPDTVEEVWHKVIGQEDMLANWCLGPEYPMTWRRATHTLQSPIDREGIAAIGGAIAFAERFQASAERDMFEACKGLRGKVLNDESAGVQRLANHLGVLVAIGWRDEVVNHWGRSIYELMRAPDEGAYELLLRAQAFFDVALGDALRLASNGFIHRISDQSSKLLSQKLDDTCDSSLNGSEALRIALAKTERRIRQVFGAWAVREVARFAMDNEAGTPTSLAAVVTKHPAAFFAKEAVGLCTRGNIEMWHEDRHAHLVVFDRVHQCLQGMALVYREVLKSVHRTRPILVIRAINPTAEAMAVFDVQSIVDAFLATAVDIARDSGCAAVAIPTDAGMHLLSNQPEVERDLHKRYIADACIGGAQPAIDGDEFWMKPVRRMDVQFDAYHRGANAVSTIYLIWRRAVCEK